MKYMSVDASKITTLEEFLNAVSLQRAGETLEEHGITTLDAVLEVTPTALESMGFPMGVQRRLLQGADMVRAAHRGAGSEDVAMIEEPAAAGMTPMVTNDHVRQRRVCNSTSSLYIDSTISKPDLSQVSSASSCALAGWATLTADPLRTRCCHINPSMAAACLAACFLRVPTHSRPDRRGRGVVRGA